MSCGTGKTYTSLKVDERLSRRDKILLLVPSMVLLSQTLREWSTYAQRKSRRIRFASAPTRRQAKETATTRKKISTWHCPRQQKWEKWSSDCGRRILRRDCRWSSQRISRWQKCSRAEKTNKKKKKEGLEAEKCCGGVEGEKHELQERKATDVSRAEEFTVVHDSGYIRGRFGAVVDGRQENLRRSGRERFAERLQSYRADGHGRRHSHCDVAGNRAGWAATVRGCGEAGRMLARKSARQRKLRRR